MEDCDDACHYIDDGLCTDFSDEHDEPKHSQNATTLWFENLDETGKLDNWDWGVNLGVVHLRTCIRFLEWNSLKTLFNQWCKAIKIMISMEYAHICEKYAHMKLECTKEKIRRESAQLIAHLMIDD